MLVPERLLAITSFAVAPVFSGGRKNIAVIPMALDARALSAWPAVGVCLCLFPAIIETDFPLQANKEISLAFELMLLL